ncbi:TolC family protein [Parabacteroides pacaensis]|uniref:TolC family protein n=1 Tax=Parabacteroides pacaensis TaxID=2086575 RepID=UPI000D10F39A|nr:TolC family protein [Parabacteroides pacaensis]
MKKILFHKRILFLVSAGLFFFIGLPVKAQDSLRLNLQQVLEIALSDNPTVRIADREIQRKKYAKLEQLADLLPNVSADASYSRTLKKTRLAFGDGEPVEIGTDNSYNGGFNLSLPLIAPTLWKTLQLSQLDVELSMEAARSSKIAMVNEVEKAYYQLLLTKDSYQVLLISYNSTEENYKNITQKFTQGLVSEFDKIRSEVQLKNMMPQLVSTKNAIYLASLQLKVLMGVDVNEPIIFEGNLVDFEDNMYGEMLTSLNDTLLYENSDLKQLDIQHKQLEKTKAINRTFFLPTLSLTSNYSWMTMANDFKFKNYQWFPNSTVGLTLSIPIFQGGKNWQKQRQTRIQIENLELQREDLVRNLQLSVNSSLSTMQTAIEEMNYSKENIKQAEKAYMISEKRYEVGSGTLLEMNDAEVALTQARLAYNQAIYNYVAARSDLEKTLGKEPLIKE